MRTNRWFVNRGALNRALCVADAAISDSGYMMYVLLCSLTSRVRDLHYSDSSSIPGLCSP